MDYKLKYFNFQIFTFTSNITEVKKMLKQIQFYINFWINVFSPYKLIFLVSLYPLFSLYKLQSYMLLVPKKWKNMEFCKL